MKKLFIKQFLLFITLSITLSFTSCMSFNNSNTLSEREIKEYLDDCIGKTVYEVMETQDIVGFTYIFLTGGKEIIDFDTRAYTIKSTALLYNSNEIRLVLAPINMYGYTGYEERFNIIGDIIEFGFYEQDNDLNNGKEAIKWVILDIDGNNILICSLYLLDNQAYNGSLIASPAKWEYCSLRTWLNSTFLEDAFTTEEQVNIKVSSIETDSSITQDKVFLLSYDEAWNYFSDELLRKAAGTSYTTANKLFVSDTTGMSPWWLRTSESDIYKFSISTSGLHENSPRLNEQLGVRPVLWIEYNIDT